MNNVAYCMQDFIAHGANVTSLALGHKSGHVLVTGGDDKKVNLWAVGKQGCIISLSGHMTPISCVRFGPTENTVCAGSVAGALKVWDLEVCRLMRTLTGHKNSVSCVEFHPYGDFLTSGSKDTSIKLWDVRRKGCIFTYKGHDEAVNSLKFSPDGQWIASAGNEGIVKLWDLRMGRMLREFTEHTGPVNAVEFHPHEFLLASASQDHSVNFWDLEHFSLVSSTNRESSPSRCLLFSNNGDILFSGAPDLLRVYGWEPARTITTKSVSWGKVRDMAVSHSDDKLIAVSYHSTNVTIWVIDTSELTGSGETCFNPEVTRDPPSGGSSPFAHGNSLRKSFTKQRPSLEAKKELRVKTIEESERSETDPEDDVQPEIHNVKDYQAVFQPSRSLNRSPPISIYESPRPERVTTALPLLIRPPPVTHQDDPVPDSETGRVDVLTESPPANRTFTLSETTHYLHASEEDTIVGEEALNSSSDLSRIKPGSTSTPTLFENLPNMANVLMDRRQSMSPPLSSSASLTNFPPHPPSTLPPSPVSTRNPQRRHSIAREPSSTLYSTHVQPHVLSSHLDNEFPVKLSSIHHSSSESSVPRATSIHTQRLSTRHGRSMSQTSTLHKPVLRETKSDRGGQLSSSPSVSPPRTSEDEFIPMSAERPAGLDFEEFLPESYHGRTAYAQTIPVMSEAEVISSMLRGHEPVMTILEARNRNLQIVYTLWQSKDLKAAVEAAINVGNDSVIVDFLNIITLRPAIWNLDICVTVLPTIFNLLQSRYETHMRAGCDALRLILRNFSPVIKSNVLSGSAGLGVDIPREERYQKCVKCYNTLVSIRAFLLKRQTLQGPLGQSFRELHISLQEIDAK